MRVIIEGYSYDTEKTKVLEVLDGLTPLENAKHKVCVGYIGYYYNPTINDCVFILPKVLIDEAGNVFSHDGLKPEDIIDIDSVGIDKAKCITSSERNFIYEFSAWIYRTIVVFNKENKNNEIVCQRLIVQMGNGNKHVSNTFLDILLSIIRFNKENQHFFTYILKNLHSGFNKINWTKTISRSNAVVQNESPFYLNPINKKRQINFDEELIIIYFSILNHINEVYGFPITINVGFDLITGTKFNRYVTSYGKKRLKQIKHKYFSDKALKLWDLCYAFFDKAHYITINKPQKEYLLVKNFNIVFEAIIDELIGDKREDLPNGLKDQEDGKIVDHIYKYKGLATHEGNKDIFYIGDSKYYKLGNNISKESVYKQYTYARNVIQWNLNLFLDGNNKEGDIKYRDDLTEGYNITPNFFISARMDENLSYKDDIHITEREDKVHISRQFENRLFDRDTLLVSHYDVNFLYIVSLYARNNNYQKRLWKNKVRDMFRSKIQNVLNEKYDFYVMEAHPGVIAENYIKKHFQDVLGKIYTPYDLDGVYSLALDRKDPENNNALLLAELRKYFYVESCKIGENPEPIIMEAKATTIVSANNNTDGVLMVMMEDYDTKSQNFINNCFIAIGLKNTLERKNIIDNFTNIHYILFHTRNDEGQHLFKVEKPCQIMVVDEIDDHIYKNIKTTSLYAVIKFYTNELDSSRIHSRNAPFEKETRYDSQYVTINKLL